MTNETSRAFAKWLASHPFDGDEPFGRTGARYQVARYCDFLETHPWRCGDPLKEPSARDEAVSAYRLYLEIFAKVQPTERTLGILDHFYVFLGLGPVTRRPDSAAPPPPAGPPGPPTFAAAVLL
jgi:hypothetical protein